MDQTSSIRRRAFTLTELFTVVGLISLLVSLFLPVVSKVRAVSSHATCLSNLRQMGAAWTMYVVESQGRLPHEMRHARTNQSVAWYGYWTGLLDKGGVRGQGILCPSANEETPDKKNGYGNVGHAWSGRYASGLDRNALWFDSERYRVSSYGFNANLTADGNGGFGALARAACFAAVRDPSNVPLFLDCAYCDVQPENLNPSVPVQSPPDLRGSALDESSPDHWRFLLARHGRGINVCMADGSSRWVPLEDTYLLTWNGSWRPYRLRLPTK